MLRKSTKTCPQGVELIAQIEAWYGSSLGREVAAQEAACLEGMLEGIFGHYLLQVGGDDVFREVVADWGCGSPPARS